MNNTSTSRRYIHSWEKLYSNIWALARSFFGTQGSSSVDYWNIRQALWDAQLYKVSHSIQWNMKQSIKEVMLNVIIHHSCYWMIQWNPYTVNHQVNSKSIKASEQAEKRKHCSWSSTAMSTVPVPLDGIIFFCKMSMLTGILDKTIYHVNLRYHEQPAHLLLWL